jgi:hypothetical protein
MAGVCWAAILLSPGPAHSQERVPFNLDNHAFRGILFTQGTRPVSAIDELLRSPDKSILVVFGDTTLLESRPREIRRFLNQGGAVLVATDRPTRALAGVGVTVTGTVVHSAEFPLTHDGSPDRPIVMAGQSKNSPFANVSGPIVANRPSFLTMARGAPPTLAWLPPGCRSGQTTYVRALPFAAGGMLGQGRLLVLADHSVFVNGLMLAPNTGNFEFAYQTIQWLREGGRDRALYLDEGQIVSDFSVPLQTLPDLPISPVELGNHLIAAMEDDDLFNRVLLENVSLDRIKKGWLLTLTVALAALAFYRFLHAGQSTDTRVPLLSTNLASVDGDESHLAARAEDRVASGDYSGVAADLARAALEDVGLRYLEMDPTLRIFGGRWIKHAWMRSIERLARIARGPRRAMTRRQFARVAADAKTIRDAAHAGILVVTGGHPRA